MRPRVNATAYTDELLDRAEALKATGLTWKEVAARMGLPHNALRTRSAVRRYKTRAGEAEPVRTCVPFSEDELRRAVKLRADGVPWQAIALRLKRNECSLRSTVGRYRRGLWRPRYAPEVAERIASIVALAEQGTPIGRIARTFGMPYMNVYVLLANRGFDAGLIREFAEAA